MSIGLPIRREQLDASIKLTIVAIPCLKPTFLQNNNEMEIMKNH